MARSSTSTVRNEPPSRGLARQFETLWRDPKAPPDVFAFLAAYPQATPREQIEVALIDQFHQWRRGVPRGFEEYCARLPALAADPQGKLELAVEEFGYREEQGEEPDIEQFLARLGDVDAGAFRRMVEGEAPPATRRVGRYRLERVLGQGSFSKVYLALDEELQRRVAIKIPHRQRMNDAHQVEMFLNEARAVAQLDHPAIAPVFDVGRTDDDDCYVVSKFIPGNSLEQRLSAGPLPPQEAAHLAATVAEALHHAHQEGFIHRDIKPANILLDDDGRPFLVDFGLALREEDLAHEQGLCGTPAYMSPEQARGEGHLVNNRSDIFSLGVVLYEMLTGRRPFQGGSWRDVLEKVRTAPPPPMRQGDASEIPAELERICLKTLAKRAADRYPTARDLADDLRHYLAHAETLPASPRVTPKGLRAFDEHDAEFFLSLLPGPTDRDGLPECVRFWKLRFETVEPRHAFRIGLAYGPSGCGKTSLFKAGILPRLARHVRVVYVDATSDHTESQLWDGVQRILADDAAKGHRLPVPRAPGAAPRPAAGSDVPRATTTLPLGVAPLRPAAEAPDPSSYESLDLSSLLALVRRGGGLQEGEKLLLVIDQFEQWLHAQGGDGDTELIRALRQCDGARVQCVLLVRDDFWLGVSRFMRQVESRIVEGHNSALVDLFDLRHARHVLASFGAAYGVLPEDLHACTPEQEAFLSYAVAGLAEASKIVCVRLALFAEMVKSKPWTPATLEAVGGASGVGLAFLEETFSARTAPPAHRLHEAAARAVLRSLLPEQGATIKGRTRTRSELLAISGYRRDEEFAELLDILDGELRLLTPVETALPPTVEGRLPNGPPAEKRYQLTHDYLVPSLRSWLTQRQQATRRGRAELRLEERAALWAVRPQKRYLPSPAEWASICFYTRGSDWSDDERRMMQSASRYYGNRTLAAVAMIATLLGAAGWRQLAADRQNAADAAAGVEAILAARPEELSQRIAALDRLRPWANPHLEAIHATAQVENNPDRQLRASLALMPEDATHGEYLYRRLLQADPDLFAVILKALAPHREKYINRLWDDLSASENNVERLRIAAALAAFAPEDARWSTTAPVVARTILGEHPFISNPWLEYLRPVCNALIVPLASTARERNGSEFTRQLAADVLVELAQDRLDVLMAALVEGDATNFDLLYAKLEAHGDNAVRRLTEALDQQVAALESARSASEKSDCINAAANLAAALARFGRTKAVEVAFQRLSDPTVRAQVDNRLQQIGVR